MSSYLYLLMVFCIALVLLVNLIVFGGLSQ